MNIKPIKDSWSRDEVAALCFQAYNLRSADRQIRSTSQMNKWIESNLQTNSNNSIDTESIKTSCDKQGSMNAYYEFMECSQEKPIN